MSVIKITNDNFTEEVMSSEKTVLLDFYATWCGPCKMLSPIVEEIATEHPELKVGKIDVDEEGELAAQFGIVSIPTIVVMKDGKLTAKQVGYVPKESLLEMLK